MERPLVVKKTDLLTDLRAIIEGARGQVARAVNTGLVALYWGVGDRIRREVLKEKRAAYGRKILVTASQELVADYGKGYSEAALGRMVQFSEKFSDFQIPATLSRKLSWSHFVELIAIHEQLKREYYAVGGYEVLLDRDAAEYFGVELKTLNRCVKRHRNRFPRDFMIEFNDGEDVDRELFGAARGFTEAGVDMLAMMLKSARAIAHSIENIREGMAALRRGKRGKV